MGVPLAAIALVLEIFGTPYGPPAILAYGVTYVLTIRLTVYDSQQRSPDPDAAETGARQIV
jgi:CIC family chloride channel protein